MQSSFLSFFIVLPQSSPDTVRLSAGDLLLATADNSPLHTTIIDSREGRVKPFDYEASHWPGHGNVATVDLLGYPAI